MPFIHWCSSFTPFAMSRFGQNQMMQRVVHGTIEDELEKISSQVAMADGQIMTACFFVWHRQESLTLKPSTASGRVMWLHTQPWCGLRAWIIAWQPLLLGSKSLRGAWKASGCTGHAVGRGVRGSNPQLAGTHFPLSRKLLVCAHYSRYHPLCIVQHAVYLEE